MAGDKLVAPFCGRFRNVLGDKFRQIKSDLIFCDLLQQRQNSGDKDFNSGKFSSTHDLSPLRVAATCLTFACVRILIIVACEKRKSFDSFSISS